MNIRGLVPFSLIDYPGKICAVVFSGGCNMRCPFCHNPCLVADPESQPEIPVETLLELLESRRGLLEGVVFSGGEPTLQDDLDEFLAKVKSMGYCVKLDTNGTLPHRVSALLEKNLLDAAGVDYKFPAQRYDGLAPRVQESIRLLLAAGVELDIRTTVHPGFLSFDDLTQMRDELLELGVSQWALQQFNEVETLDDSLAAIPRYSDEQLLHFSRDLGDFVHVRGLLRKDF
ncbi:MAG: anaerobic ribonucleoside-triphosphate reductase activating protein [Planctomycetia bacterium]|nr:anaerobic ribonucleoside-triphosphate reductase activating protein [Planctomycetia bacterium]